MSILSSLTGNSSANEGEITKGAMSVASSAISSNASFTSSSTA